MSKGSGRGVGQPGFESGPGCSFSEEPCGGGDGGAITRPESQLPHLSNGQTKITAKIQSVCNISTALDRHMCSVDGTRVNVTFTTTVLIVTLQ